MRLEKQGAHDDDLTKDVDHLASELKSRMDARIWAPQIRP